jgi:ubiquinone/menaquinone biosynthesis C-methylase UbiE
MPDIMTHFIQELQNIAARCPRPRPFVDIGSLPWADVAFSQHFLRTATRSERYTRREMTFLEQCGVVGPGRTILDLACGGGRHSIAMAKRGASVTGVDIGPAALAMAKRRAKRARVSIEFVQNDLRCLDYDSSFDATTCIFGCLTEMPRQEALEVFHRVAKSLRPGGMFVFDVYSPRFFAALDGEQEWWIGKDFIAGRALQLVLTEYFYYPRDKTYARRDFICHAETGAVHTFGLSGQAYTLADLNTMLSTAQLTLTAAYSSWSGDEIMPDSPLYLILASKTLG